MIDWKDATDYTAGTDPGDEPPTAWETTVGHMKIRVGCDYVGHKDEWILECEPWFPVKGKQATVIGVLGDKLPVLLANATDLVHKAFEISRNAFESAMG